MENILHNNKICAIMRNVPLEQTIDYAAAVYEGGIRMFEIAMNSTDAAAQIKMLRQRFQSDVFIGAGTVISKERCKEAEDAGAEFFLTPSVSVDTLEYCCAHEIPLLPGVLTPTDVSVCINYGFHIMKLFPAGDMQKGYIKSLQGPFDGTRYVAVGGVTPDNIKEFLDNGFVGVGIGSNLISKDMIINKQWDKAKGRIAAIVSSVQ